MTLTLQDAQHVSWKTFLKINDKVGGGRGESWNASAVVTDLLRELEK